jgi:hypothetical protein
MVCTGPIGTGVAPQAYDIEFDVLKKDNSLGTFTVDKASQWGSWVPAVGKDIPAYQI